MASLFPPSCPGARKKSSPTHRTERYLGAFPPLTLPSQSRGTCMCRGIIPGLISRGNHLPQQKLPSTLPRVTASVALLVVQGLKTRVVAPDVQRSQVIVQTRQPSGRCKGDNVCKTVSVATWTARFWMWRRFMILRGFSVRKNVTSVLLAIVMLETQLVGINWNVA